METINILEAKNKFSSLIANVEKGLSYLICKNGKPVAKITAHNPKDRLKTHPQLQVKVHDRLYGDEMSEDWECLH